MARKLHVLCLHGFNSNASVFGRRTRAWADACADVATFTYLDAPHLVPPYPAMMGVDKYATTAELALSPAPPDDADDDAKEAYLQSLAQAQTRVAPERRARGWWRLLDQDPVYLWGWPETVQYLSQRLQQLGPLDAVIGFSQGGALALLLAAACERNKVSRGAPLEAPPIPGLVLHPDQGPLKLCISISGFRSRDPRHQASFEHALLTPALFINGQRDALVTPARSARATTAFSSKREYFHAGGHLVPLAAPWPTFVRETLLAQSSAEPHWRKPPQGILTELEPSAHDDHKSHI